MILRKVLKSLALTAVVASVFAVPVFATPINFSFYVDTCEGVDNVAYSGNAYKSDDDDYARITYWDSNITPHDDFTFCVVGQYMENSEYSETIYANAAEATYYPYYTKQMAYNRNFYRLRGITYAYNVYVNGEFNP